MRSLSFVHSMDRSHAIVQPVVCLFLWRSGLIPRIVQVQSVLDKVVLRQAFLQVQWYCCTSCCTVNATLMIGGTIGPFEAVVPGYLVSPHSHNQDKKISAIIHYSHSSYIYYLYKDARRHARIYALTRAVCSKMYVQG
jgi:hypothetical protein